MRILLTANASYAPPRGGATRSNLIWLDALARNGHACRIVCGPSKPGAEFRHHESIQVVPVEEPARRVQTLRREIAAFRPDWVLVSSEDLGHGLLREAHHSAPGRVVYLAHTPQFFPFGPASWNPNPFASDLVAESAGIVAIGRHMADYVERAVHRAPTVIHPPIYGEPPFPRYDNFERGLIAMINPCAVKGISLFLPVAERLPQYQFGALPGWGTTAHDRAALELLPNCTLLPHARHIDDFLTGVRLLLAPSLWYEGFGLIVMEAMLRGIPVIASNSGGLLEAKRGTGYVIPVNTIDSYQPAYDEHAMPRPVVPANDAAPWIGAIEKLLTDRTEYQREAGVSRAAGLLFVRQLDAHWMEHFLARLKPFGAPQAEKITVESLSPEKRALLLERLRKRGMVR
jgi:glycosyltransferase involved in cell wall biosynthesis